jgi:excisionase family DNA binding protein
MVSSNDRTEKRWFSVLEAAAYLGCSPNLIRNLLHNGELRASNVGVLYRIEKSDLDSLMLRRKRRVPPYRKGTHPWVSQRHERARNKKAVGR